MPWVDYSLGRKRGRDSTSAIRGCLNLAISIQWGTENYLLCGKLVMLVVGICLVEYTFRLTYSPLQGVTILLKTKGMFLQVTNSTVLTTGLKPCIVLLLFSDPFSPQWSVLLWILFKISLLLQLQKMQFSLQYCPTLLQNIVYMRVTFTSMK